MLEINNIYILSSSYQKVVQWIYEATAILEALEYPTWQNISWGKEEEQQEEEQEEVERKRKRRKKNRKGAGKEEEKHSEEK